MPTGRRAPRSKGYVDYEHHATRYRAGRALAADVLERWGVAIGAHLPTTVDCVVDVGAGTGIFAEAWPRWLDALVVAVEPAEAMATVGAGAAPAARFVRGIAEALPLGDGTADAVWVSTALHHFTDVDRAVAEFRRVLRPRGRVLVRALVPGRTEITYLKAFPGRSHWVGRFPDERTMRELFGRHGFDTVDVEEVLERTEPFGRSADWVSRMRHTDSLCTALDDDQIDEALARLRADPTRVGRLELTLLVFERR